MNTPPENPFSDVGCILSGARVIGRDYEIQQLRNRLCAKSGHGSIAIIGIPRIGKSSLIQRALLDDTATFAVAKIVCSRIDVGTLTSFDDLLKSMVRGTLTEVRKFNLGGKRLENLAAQVFTATGEGGWERAKDLFQALRALQIRPICVLDEFDATRRLFHGHVQPFLRLRHLASATDCKVGLVLVCKRDLAALSQLAGLDSNYWHNAVGAELYLRGLDDRGMNSYFEVLDQAGISLGNRVRDELVRMCGTHPYLLDLFAAEAFPLASTGKVIDLNTCRELATPLVPKAFSQLIEVLRDGSELSELRAAFGERPPCPTSMEIQALVRLGVLVQDGHGNTKPFASMLPDYLRSLNSHPSAAVPPLGSETQSPALPALNPTPSPRVEKLTQHSPLPRSNTVSSPPLSKLVVHTNQPLVEVNGARLDNLSVSQYALIRTLADKFNFDNADNVKQAEVLKQTGLLLRALAAEKPGWFNDAEIKAWGEQSKAAPSAKSGENRQLWNELKGKLSSNSAALPLLAALPQRGTPGGFKLQVPRRLVTFRP